MSSASPLKYSQIPHIDRYLNEEDFHQVVPIDMYPEYIQSAVTNTEDKLNPVLVITFHPDVIESPQNEIIIPTALLNSKIAQVETPLFLFENSTRNKSLKSLPYFEDGVSDPRVLNMNQLLYMIIQHRLAYFKRSLSPEKKLYLDLLRNNDLGALKSFIEFKTPVTFNERMKVENTYVIFNNMVFNLNANCVIGERLKNNGFAEEDWQLVMRDLYPFLRPTSESSFDGKCKLVLSPSRRPIYRAPAYSFSDTIATSIFPFKANLVARLKTHITGGGIKLANPDKSCFKHDLLFKDGHTTLLDETTKYVLVAFHPMDFETKRFVAGELEASERIAKTSVIQQQHVSVFTDELSNISVVEGATYYPNGKPFNFVTKDYIDPLTQNVKENKIYGVQSFIVKYIKALGNNVVRVTIEKTMRAGNARITSKTGLKGVTNITGSDRHVYIAPVGKTIHDIDDHKVRETLINMRTRKLKKSHPNYEFLQSVNGELEQINSVSYKTVNPQVLKDCGWIKKKVDIVTGMNAVKAKTNTIILAQALLAVEMGYYTPEPKGKDGIYTGILDASNELEINRAAESLPDMVYLDENNVPNKCYIGLVPINFTELGKTYAKFKPQSFSFESGNVIKSVHKPLFDHIFNTYLEEDKRNVCLELYEILEDFDGKLAITKDLPSYNLAQLRNHITKDDLLISSTSRDLVDSILFSTDFNPNGFIIDIRKSAKNADINFKTQLIRIPSASTLRYFMTRRNDGTYMYDRLLKVISQILVPLLGFRNLRDAESGENQNKDFVPYYYIFKRKNIEASAQSKTSLDSYYSTLQGTVYSSQDASRNLTQSLVKPKVPGFSLKQVVNSLIPNDAIVLLDSHLYKCTYLQAGKHDLIDPDSDYNTVLDLAIYASTNEEKLEIKDALLDALDLVPLLLVNRNPFLWKSQQLVRKFYGYREFKAYLNVIHNIDLDYMLSSEFNKDVVYMSPLTALVQKSDVDK